MFDHPRFRASTWRVDAVSIWGAAIVAVATGVAGIIEGFGMAISLLLAFGVLPLAFVTILLVWQHKRIIEAVKGWFRPPMEEPPQALEYMYDPQNEAPDIAAYYDIMGFALTFLLPACDSQFELQSRLIEKLSQNETICRLSISGLQNPDKKELRDFWDNYDRILRGVDSSEPTIRFSALIECIRGLERDSYRRFCEQLNEIADSSGIDYRKDPEIVPLWEDWREHHNALVKEYDKVKRDVRFEKLFFPRREGRWGGIIPG